MRQATGALRRARPSGATSAAAIAIALVVGLLVPVPVAAQQSPAEAYPRPGVTSRISEIGGMDVNGPSDNPSVSADGRYVAFLTNATDLVPDDRNGSRTDVVVADRITGGFGRVSVSSDGIQANHISRYPGITPDGRYVVFQSDATNLVPGDTNKSADVFVHDRDADGNGIFDEPGGISTERVSVATGGTQARWGVRPGGPDIGPPSISPDGRYVAFPSWSDDLIPQDTNSAYDVFLHDRLENKTELVSVSTEGTQANSRSSTHRDVGGGTSLAPVVSEDGRQVVFWSGASNLVSGDTNGDIDIFVRDRLQQTTERLSTNADREEGDAPSFDASITPDGRHVVFTSSASNLVPVDEPDGATLDYDTFVRDRDGNENGVFDEPDDVKVERVSVASDGTEADGSYSGQAAISEDGRYISFASDATNLVTDDTNAQFDVFVRDRHLRVTERVSRSDNDDQGEDYSWLSAVSADGRYVGFETSASGLTPTFRADNYDLLLRDRGPEVGIGRLKASTRSEAVRVNGSATFSGTVLAAATADPRMASGQGIELVAADLTYRVEQQDLLVRVEPDGLPRVTPPCCLRQGVSGTPVVYGFEIMVDGIAYQARATAPTQRVASFDLYRCDAGCTQEQALTGSFGTTRQEVLVSVPLAAIGAAGGSELEGLRAFATLGPDGPELDAVDLEAATVPAASTAVGIAPHGTSPDQIALQDVSPALSAGRFTTDLPTSGLAAGIYDVAARACLGERCGSEVTSVQVGDVMQPKPTGDIDDLSAEIAGDSVRVTGTTRLAEEAVLGTDPVEAQKVVPGSDLTAASITFKNPQTLVFSVDVANFGPMNGVPESLRYGWDFTVTPPYEGQPHTGRYELLASRSTAAQPNRHAGKLEPRFVLYDGFTGTSSFARRFKREVAGKMGDGVVQWEVLLSDIGAKPGSVISAIDSSPILGVPDTELHGVTSEHVIPSPLPGSAYNRWVPPLDHVKPIEDYEVPDTKVQLGIAKDGVSDGDVDLTTTGKMATNGFFRGDLPLPDTAGTYKVVAQACLREACVRGSTKIVVKPDAVEPAETVLSFTDENAKSGHFTDEVTFEARLLDIDQEAIAGAPLTFELQGEHATLSFGAVTDSDGEAGKAITLNEPPGPYRLTVRYADSDDHLGSADVAGFVIEREETEMSLTIEGRGKDRVLVSRLLDADDGDAGIAGRTIYFYVDDRPLGTAETNASGEATLTPEPRYRHGKHIYEAEFAGDDFFHRSSARKGA